MFAGWSPFACLSDSTEGGTLAKVVSSCVGRGYQEDGIRDHLLRREVTMNMVMEVGAFMMKEHHVPKEFQGLIVQNVLALRFEMGGAGDGRLGEDEWQEIRRSELVTIFLFHIIDIMSMGRQINTEANASYSFVSPVMAEHASINVGDPFFPGGNSVNTYREEVKALEICMGLVGANSATTKGYVATGTSESNTNAVWRASQKFPNGLFVGGKNMHFSLTRAIQEVFKHELVLVDSSEGGAMDMDALERVLVEAKQRGVEEICLIAVHGTTVYGAKDDIDEANRRLAKAGYVDDDKIYRHVDAAFDFFVTPFLKDVPPGIGIDFDRQRLNSCCGSAQKSLGSPCMGSVFLIRGEDLKSEFYQYIRSSDPTLSCSRYGVAASQLFYRLRHIVLGVGRDEWSLQWERCVAAASLFAERLRQARVEGVVHNPFSVTVVFPMPCNYLVEKFFLVTRKALDGVTNIAVVMFNFHMLNLNGHVADLFFQEYIEWYNSQG